MGETIRGTDADETIATGPGNDLIFGSLGTDTVDGGPGFDVLRFEGLPATFFYYGYTNQNGFVLNEIGRLNTDDSDVTTFRDIERIEFLDATIELSGSSLAAQVVNLYDGLLGREARLHEISFWVDAAEAFGIGTVTAQIIGSAEFAAGPGNLPQDQIIGRLYGAALNREASADEVAFWNGQASAFGMSAVVTGIVTSQEAATDPGRKMVDGIPLVDRDAAWIGHSFEGLLNRNADLGGYGFFLDRMHAGLDEKGLVSAIAASQEFAQGLGALDNDGFVGALYRQILDREAEAAGKAGFVAALESGATRSDVAFSILDSTEARQFYDAKLQVGVDLLG